MKSECGVSALSALPQSQESADFAAFRGQFGFESLNPLQVLADPFRFPRYVVAGRMG